jgi:hypothetical protein
VHYVTCRDFRVADFNHKQITFNPPMPVMMGPVPAGSQPFLSAGGIFLTGFKYARLQ